MDGFIDQGWPWAGYYPGAFDVEKSGLFQFEVQTVKAPVALMSLAMRVPDWSKICGCSIAERYR